MSTFQPSSTTDAQGLRIWSCIICRRRKVRCDRREPCLNCIKANVDCHYPRTGRLPRRRDPALAPRTTQAEKQDELINRLRRLESIVIELSAQVEEGVQSQGLPGGSSIQIPLPLGPEVTRALSRAGSAGNWQPTPPDSNLAPVDTVPASAEDDYQAYAQPDQVENFGELITAKDGALHVGNRFFTIFCDEVDHIFRAVEDVTALDEADAPEKEPESAAPMAMHHGFFFGGSAGLEKIDNLQPSLSQLRFLWSAFVHNVDPFIKILHIPTIEKTISSIQSTISTLLPETQSLMAAISLAAAVSLEEEQVAVNFNVSKDQLLTKLRLGVEASLARAEVITATSLNVIQAFVIYLSVLPYMGAGSIAKPLVGLLVRIATNIGLHKDGSNTLGMSFFEAEIRRRVWWQTYLLDESASDPSLSQLSITETMFDTSTPCNIHDEALSSDSPASLMYSQDNGITGTTLFLIRCALRRLAREIGLNKSKTTAYQLGLVNSARNTVTSTYFNDNQHGNNFHTYVQTMTTFAFAKIEAMLYTQALKPTLEQSNQQITSHPAFTQLLKSSLEIVETAHLLMTEDKWRNWRWQQSGQMPGHAMGIVALHLCQKPWDQTSEKVFDMAKGLFEALSHGTGVAMRSSVEGLLSKASVHRQAYLSLNNTAQTSQSDQDSSMTLWNQSCSSQEEFIGGTQELRLPNEDPGLDMGFMELWTSEGMLNNTLFQDYVNF